MITVRIFPLVLGIALLSGCGSSEGEGKSVVENTIDSAEQVVVQQNNTPKHALLNTYTLNTGTSFIVVEKKRSASLSLITVQGTGFSDSQDVFTFRNVDPIQSTEIADLDSDGYQEIYIITRSVGSGSYGNIIGAASIKDKTYEKIAFNQTEEGNPNFEGYMGLDRFRFVEGRLLRDIPVYKEGDTNNKPTGGVRMLVYDLERTEDGLSLVLQRSSEH